MILADAPDSSQCSVCKRDPNTPQEPRTDAVAGFFRMLFRLRVSCTTMSSISAMVAAPACRKVCRRVPGSNLDPLRCDTDAGGWTGAGSDGKTCAGR